MDMLTFQTNILTCEEMLYRVAKSICFNECDCEDAVQESILNAYGNLDSLRDEKYFRTWLTRILINECYKINKKKSRQACFDDYLFVEETKETEYSYVFEAIMCLPEKIRVAVQLHYVEGYSVDETASILRIPSGTVKSRLSQGRKKLKSILEEEL